MPDQACRSPMGLRSDILVSNEALSLIGLQWVFDEACRSPMCLRSGMLVSDGSQIDFRWVSDRSPMGLR